MGPSRRRVFVAQPAFPNGNEHHPGHHPTATTHNNKQKQGRLAERAAAVQVICLAPQKTTALAASINDAIPVMRDRLACRYSRILLKEIYLVSYMQVYLFEQYPRVPHHFLPACAGCLLGTVCSGICRRGTPRSTCPHRTTNAKNQRNPPPARWSWQWSLRNPPPARWPCQ